MLDAFSDDEIRLIGTLRQGDVIEAASLPVDDGQGEPQRHATPHGVVLISQTCDAIRPEKPTALLAPLVRLTDSTAGNARSGKMPRYVAVSLAGQDAFADLSVIATVDKSMLIPLPRSPGLDPCNDDEARRFGRAIGRHFGRFAFPDEVVPWLRPLETVVQAKHDKASSEGAAMRDVVELRVEALGGWRKPSYALTLCVIVKPGILPATPDGEPPLCPPGLADWLRDETGRIRQKPAAIADRLAVERSRSPSSAAVYWLWLSLAEAWAAGCQPDLRRYTPDEASAIVAAVSGVDADLIEETEYNLYRYRRSEQLDLDHLSPPVPLLAR